MSAVGYGYLLEALKLVALPLRCPAQVRPVTRLTRIGNTLSVPQAMAPTEGDYLGHVLFAIKHEGINLGVLAQALPKIPAEVFEAALASAPNGIYLRKACFLHEAFTGVQIAQPKPVAGKFIPLFDPERYVTGPAQRNSRWRVEFNGIGNLNYCATVERTAEIEELLGHDILGRARAFIQSLPPVMMDRAINWAYLHETRDSFAIEREAASEEKARRFIHLLRQAHDRQPLSEDYLVGLQNAAVSNPLDLAAAFRHEQNYLSNGSRGAAGVTYLPPPPELCRELMDELMTFANNAASGIDPLVAAGVISFGFVLLHPFMDGNGRLSRFLIHHCLCRAGALENGLLLPVSVAMKREEKRYLDALQDFSRAAREFWEVRWLDAESLTFEFVGHPAIYRYWDATMGVAFILEMARRALEVELHEETLFLARYDAVYKVVDERYDVRGSDLANLVMMCLSNNGVVSQNRRRQFQYTVPEQVFDYIEQAAREQLAAQADESSPPA
jgi:hypothetical protein